jgi:chromosome segregation ATPase
VDEDRERLLVYARCLAADIPRGQLGSAIAVELAWAVCEASRLRLLDITGSALEIFRVLVRLGLLRSLPSQRVMPAALALLASVSPLVERRSPRCWTIRSGQALDPESAVGKVIRERTPRYATPVVVADSEIRRPPSSIRGERDHLQVELHTAQAELERLTRALSAAEGESTQLAARLASAVEATERAEVALATTRARETRLADDLAAARASHESEQRRLQDALTSARARRDELAHTETLLRVSSERVKKQFVAMTSERDRLISEITEKRRTTSAQLSELDERIRDLSDRADAARASCAAAEKSQIRAENATMTLLQLIGRLTQADPPGDIEDAERVLTRKLSDLESQIEQTRKYAIATEASRQFLDNELNEMRKKSAYEKSLNEVIRGNADWRNRKASEMVEADDDDS